MGSRREAPSSLDFRGGIQVTRREDRPPPRFDTTQSAQILGFTESVNGIYCCVPPAADSHSIASQPLFSGVDEENDEGELHELSEPLPRTVSYRPHSNTFVCIP